MKSEAKETSCRQLIVVICISAIVLIILVTFWVTKSISSYNECVKLVPPTSWFEEDLEKIFFTNRVYVTDIDDKRDGSIVVEIYILTFNDYREYHRCLYSVKSRDSFNWHWALVKYI